MRIPFRRRLPDPPENVRLVLSDGSMVPVDCRYDGCRDGTHHWSAVRPVITDGLMVTGVRADMIPAKTAISMEAQLWRIQ